MIGIVEDVRQWIREYRDGLVECNPVILEVFRRLPGIPLELRDRHITLRVLEHPSSVSRSRANARRLAARAATPFRFGSLSGAARRLRRLVRPTAGQRLA